MSKIEQNKEKKRRAILTAAQSIFLSEGFVLSSMDRISAAAGMTKQTVYRYFPSKTELFQATLQHMGERFDEQYASHLDNPDIRTALLSFAKDFIAFHISDEHIDTFRLLVAEGGKAPEIISSFMSVGPDNTDTALSDFFAGRLNLEKTATPIRLWTGMLLEPRSAVLMGKEKPDQDQIGQYAREATDFLLAAVA